MARPLRIEHAGGYYHVTARGVGQGAIFFDGDNVEGRLYCAAFRPPDKGARPQERGHSGGGSQTRSLSL